MNIDEEYYVSIKKTEFERMKRIIGEKDNLKELLEAQDKELNSLIDFVSDVKSKWWFKLFK